MRVRSHASYTDGSFEAGGGKARFTGGGSARVVPCVPPTSNAVRMTPIRNPMHARIPNWS